MLGVEEVLMIYLIWIFAFWGICSEVNFQTAMLGRLFLNWYWDLVLTDDLGKRDRSMEVHVL